MIRLTRSGRPILLLLATFFISLHLLGLRPQQILSFLFPFQTKQRISAASYSPELLDFWDNFSSTLTASTPPVPLPNKSIEALINSFAQISSSFAYRQDLIELSDQDVETLRDSHTEFVKHVRALAPRLPYKNGSQGIVMTASGEFMPQLVVSLRMLRRSASKLPVEVFMENREVYEPELCQNVLAGLNATCYIMEDILGNAHTKITLSKYQLKPFALLFSTFDNILLLDADNLAVQPPESWINAEPFTSAGLVAWPDYVYPSLPHSFHSQLLISHSGPTQPPQNSTP